jgi:hypothetical protein
MKINERDHRLLVSWAADCAEHVIARFEEKHPDDARPRKAIESSRAWVRGEVTTGEARASAFAAHAAARDTADPAARAAARAAGHATATAHAVGHARHAAAYAIKAVCGAAVTADSAAAAEKERDWQYRQLPKHLRPVVI